MPYLFRICMGWVTVCVCSMVKRNEIQIQIGSKIEKQKRAPRKQTLNTNIWTNDWSVSAGKITNINKTSHQSTWRCKLRCFESPKSVVLSMLSNWRTDLRKRTNIHTPLPAQSLESCVSPNRIGVGDQFLEYVLRAHDLKFVVCAYTMKLHKKKSNDSN